MINVKETMESLGNEQSRANLASANLASENLASENLASENLATGRGKN
jgi:hypothetical protein